MINLPRTVLVIEKCATVSLEHILFPCKQNKEMEILTK